MKKEQDLEELDAQDFAELDSLSDFVDIDDLENLEGMEEFSEMLDVDALPDLEDMESDMEDVAAQEVTSEESLGEEESDSFQEVPFDTFEDSIDLLPEESVDALDALSGGEADVMDLLPEEEDISDFPIPEMSQETVVAEDTKMSSSEENLDVMSETEGDGDLDVMLDGLLDDLDMTGSLADTSTEMTSFEEAPDADAADLFDMLGGNEEKEPEDDILDIAMPEVDNQVSQEADAQEKPGLLKRLFGNIVTDEIAEAERKAMEEEEQKAAEKAEEDEKKKEEKEAQKIAANEEKAVKKAAKQEAKAVKKAEKEAKKAEKKAKREEEEAAEQLEVVGKLNKVGVAIIVALTIAFLTIEIAGTHIHGYRSVKKQANTYFEMGKYEQAYREVMGTKVKEKDPETYNKIRTVMQVQRAIDSYSNYNEMNYYPEALNALIQGLRRYDANLESARELEVVSQLEDCKGQIVQLLQKQFGMSENQARELLSLDKEEYTRRVVEIAVEKGNLASY